MVLILIILEYYIRDELFVKNNTKGRGLNPYYTGILYTRHGKRNVLLTTRRWS